MLKTSIKNEQQDPLNLSLDCTGLHCLGPFACADWAARVSFPFWVSKEAFFFCVGGRERNLPQAC